MPLLPRSFEAPARRRRPDRVGEEGILHKVDLQGERFFVKHWYSYQIRRPELQLSNARKRHLSVRETKIETLQPKDHEDIAFSPYWHKAVYFEQQAIHRMFPEHTIAPRTAYDPRIDPQNQSFDPNLGLPVTVAEEVNIDEATAAPLQDILDRLYAQLIEHQQRFGKDPDAYQQLTGLEKFKQELTTLLQIDYDMTPADPELPWIEAVIKKMQATHPHHIVTQLLQAGVLPIHPAVNYLPTAPLQPGEPRRGVFVETSIVDQKRFRHAVEKQPPAVQAAVESDVRRLDFWRSYDDLFERLQVSLQNVLRTAQLPRQMITEPIIATALFRCSEHMRRYRERFAQIMFKRSSRPISENDMGNILYVFSEALEAMDPHELADLTLLAEAMTRSIADAFDIKIEDPK